MDRRAFVCTFAGLAITGRAGLCTAPAPREDETRVLADVDRDAEILSSSGMANGGTALLLGVRKQQDPDELETADLIQFSPAGARLISVPVLATIGSHFTRPIAHATLDCNGALWTCRSRANVGAEAGAGLKNSELVQIDPGEPVKTFQLDSPLGPQAPQGRTLVTAMTSEPDVVWCALSSSSGPTVLRFQVSSQALLSSRGSNAGGFCCRFFRADVNRMVAAYLVLSKTKLSSSVDVFDDLLQPVASAIADGWIQDVAYTAAAGTTPAKLYLAVTKDMWGSSSLSVETLAFPDLRRESVQTWSESDKSVRGSVLFVKVNDAPALVRMSSATMQVLARPLVGQAAERVLAVPPPIRRAQDAYPLRSGVGVRYLLDIGYVANGRIRRQLILSADLEAAVRASGFTGMAATL